LENFEDKSVAANSAPVEVGGEGGGGGGRGEMEGERVKVN